MVNFHFIIILLRSDTYYGITWYYLPKGGLCYLSDMCRLRRVTAADWLRTTQN